MRQTVLAAVGGASVLLGVGYTARTYQLSRRGQVTGRFSTAMGQLASGKLEERLGAVYGLEHVLAESPQDHDTVVSVLAAFVRENARKPALPSAPTDAEEPRPPRAVPAMGTEPPADIKAAVEVLARRPERDEPRRIDLRSTQLVGLILRSFEFDAPPRLSRAFLTWADLCRADLRGADLTDSILSRADLSHSMLAWARLDDAGLANADLRGAHLAETTLLGTDLSGADLRDTKSLTARQLAGAVIDEATQLPPTLASDPWVMARLVACRAWRNQEQWNAHTRPPPATAPVG
ncbi:pentapeptide repeat-containing protein [Streptomyces sp. NPDC056975]|uniref:pentapeptide repeat-containing protein n=1 Tax=Streptomyces sp. NPDC056975 TaxID=3345985 RepID=UPI003638D1A7